MPENNRGRTWRLPDEPIGVLAVRDGHGRLLVRADDDGDALWWFGRLGAGVGYEWHEVLRFGPLSEASNSEAAGLSAAAGQPSNEPGA